MSDRNAELSRLNNDQIKPSELGRARHRAARTRLDHPSVSPQAEKQLDLRGADVGRPIGHMRHDLAMDDSESPLDLGALAAEVMSNVREQECEVRNRGTQWYSLRVRPYITPDNKVDGVVLVLMDITAIKQAQAAQASLAAIVACSDDAIISKDLRGVIQTWNRTAERLFGYTADEAIGKPAMLLIPLDRSSEESEILERIRRGDMVDPYETVRRRKDGSRLDISHTIRRFETAPAASSARQRSYEVARRLRDEFPHRRILLVSVSGYQRNAALLRGADFDQHLLKPLDINKLVVILTAWDRGETMTP